MDLDKVVDIYDVSHFQINKSKIVFEIDLKNNIINFDGIIIPIKKKNSCYEIEIEKILKKYKIFDRKEYSFLKDGVVAYFRTNTKKTIYCSNIKVHDKFLIPYIIILYFNLYISDCLDSYNNYNENIIITLINPCKQLEDFYIGRCRRKFYGNRDDDIIIYNTTYLSLKFLLEYIGESIKFPSTMEESKNKEKTIAIPAYYIFENDCEEQEGEIEIVFISDDENVYNVYVKNFILPNGEIIKIDKRKNKYVDYYSKIFDLSLQSRYNLITESDLWIIKEELQYDKKIEEINLNPDDFKELFNNKISITTNMN